ncbi:prepilin peptidase [Candidatus Woesearchaeota archaeon]|nr:prepilin peptidase [Candidatus Woesearchaeota archaeon]
MIDIILISLVFLILAVGTVTDFKTREVPDWVNYSAIFAGLGIRLAYSVSTFEWSYIIEGVLGFAVFLALALMMFYLGQWGGGDSKMLMGIGALIGLQFRPDHLFVAFFVNMLIAGAVYGILWGIILAVKHKSKFVPFVRKTVRTKGYKLAKKVLFVMVALLLISSFLVDVYTAIFLVTSALVLFIMFYSWLLLTAVEKTSLVKFVPVEKLTEGDWIVKDVVVEGKRITGPKDLGISREQIKKLLKLRQEGKIRQVLVKEGMPFVPVFFIAMIISVIWGNLVLLFV